MNLETQLAGAVGSLRDPGTARRLTIALMSKAGCGSVVFCRLVSGLDIKTLEVDI